MANYDRRANVDPATLMRLHRAVETELKQTEKQTEKQAGELRQALRNYLNLAEHVALDEEMDSELVDPSYLEVLLVAMTALNGFSKAVSAVENYQPPR